MNERPFIAKSIDRKAEEIVKYQSNFSSYSISRNTKNYLCTFHMFDIISCIPRTLNLLAFQR